MDANVVLVVEEIADRMPDRRLLEQPGRDLVEQGLEGVVIVRVDEHDVDVALPKLLGGADPREAATQDENARSLVAGPFSLRHHVVQSLSLVATRLCVIPTGRSAPLTVAAAAGSFVPIG